MTAATDIYSLGLVVFEALTGVRAIQGKSAAVLIEGQMNAAIPSVRANNPQLPAAIDAVLAVATAKAPSDRYPTAIRFAQAFRAALPGPRSPQPLPEALTERELDVLRLMAEGLTNAGIAERLFLTAETVKWYKKQIYSKLNAHSKEMVLAQARSLGLLDAEVEAEAEAVPATAAVPSTSAPAQPDPLSVTLTGSAVIPRVLLVLDNFEHLLDGAELIAEILHTAPGVKMLITSRERLNLSLETVYPLGGMDVPALSAAEADLLNSSAVRLFVGAARRTHVNTPFAGEDLRRISKICRLVGGMPLAILLAASWTELLSVAEVLEEVRTGLDALESEWRDLPERQRSLRAVFDSTWARLNDRERAAMMRLSVFHGGFTRKAAETVAGASLRLLSSLINKALVVMDAEGRCAIHELVRQYAAEHLAQSGEEAEARAAHSAYYLAALADSEPELVRHNQLTVLANIRADQENVRAAWEWAIAANDWTGLAKALHALWLFFAYGGAYLDGDQLLGALADKLRNDAQSPERDSLLLDALTHQAYLAINSFERVHADQLLDEAEILLGAGADAQRAEAFFWLVRAVRMPWEEDTGRLEAAHAAHRLYSAQHDVWGETMSIVMLHWTRGYYDFTPERQHELVQALTSAQSLGDSFVCARLLTLIALDLQHSPDDHAATIASFEQVLSMRRAQGNPHLISNALVNVALTWVEMGHYETAHWTNFSKPWPFAVSRATAQHRRYGRHRRDQPPHGSTARGPPGLRRCLLARQRYRTTRLAQHLPTVPDGCRLRRRELRGCGRTRRSAN
ncbi:MAG: hypothetical protein IPK19_15155 [Chloroflexi bacterium]|nr:hypothetical protein [Chloroflexota bacterium]